MGVLYQFQFQCLWGDKVWGVTTLQRVVMSVVLGHAHVDVKVGVSIILSRHTGRSWLPQEPAVNG